MPLAIATLIASVGVVLLGCEDNAAVPRTVVDSAGVEIVVSSGREPQLGMLVNVTSSISFDSDDLLQIQQARILSDGRVAVADNGDSQLKIVDVVNGRAVRVGREGDGPGEFRGFRHVFVCGNDDLLVVTGDFVFKKVTPSGRVEPASHFTGIQAPLYGVRSDCTGVVGSVPKFQNAGESDSIAIAWIGDGRTVEFVELALQERQWVEFLGERLPIPVPFGARPFTAVARDRVLISDRDLPELREFNSDGRLVRIIRWHAERQAVRRLDRRGYDSLSSTIADEVGNLLAERIPVLDRFRLPERMPVVGGIIAGEEYIWVRRYPGYWQYFEGVYGPRYQLADPEWWVFDYRGRLVGRGRTPRGFRILDVRGGMAAAVSADSMDVLRLHLLPLASLDSRRARR